MSYCVVLEYLSRGDEYAPRYEYAETFEEARDRLAQNLAAVHKHFGREELRDIDNIKAGYSLVSAAAVSSFDVCRMTSPNVAEPVARVEILDSDRAESIETLERLDEIISRMEG